MDWKVGEAKQRFSEVLRAAEKEPQPVYRRDRMAAVVVSAAAFRELEELRRRAALPNIAEATEELRRLVAEEGDLQIPPRRDRPNTFLAVSDDDAAL